MGMSEGENGDDEVELRLRVREDGAETEEIVRVRPDGWLGAGCDTEWGCLAARPCAGEWSGWWRRELRLARAMIRRVW